MGKTTLYHPVSLYVIRASLIRCGITPGRIKQNHANIELGQALYTTTLESLPKELRKHSPKQLLEALQSCFASDVVILTLYHKYSMKQKHSVVVLQFRTYVNPPAPERETPDDPDPGHADDPERWHGQDLAYFVDEPVLQFSSDPF